jgi:hypothetical protein
MGAFIYTAQEPCFDMAEALEAVIKFLRFLLLEAFISMCVRRDNSSGRLTHISVTPRSLRCYLYVWVISHIAIHTRISYTHHLNPSTPQYQQPP